MSLYCFSTCWAGDLVKRSTLWAFVVMNSLKADCKTPNKQSQSNVYNWNACRGTFFLIKKREMLKMGAILRPKICQRGQGKKKIWYLCSCATIPSLLTGIAFLACTAIRQHEVLAPHYLALCFGMFAHPLALWHEVRCTRAWGLSVFLGALASLVKGTVWLQHKQEEWWKTLRHKCRTWRWIRGGN